MRIRKLEILKSTYKRNDKNNRSIGLCFIYRGLGFINFFVYKYLKGWKFQITGANNRMNIGWRNLEIFRWRPEHV